MNEIESVEQVKTDQELIALTKRVMDQNDAILRMNGRLLDMLTSPVLLVRGKDTANAPAHRRGEAAYGEADGSASRFTLDPESGFVRDNAAGEWLTTAEEVFDAMFPLLPNENDEGRP